MTGHDDAALEAAAAAAVHYTDTAGAGWTEEGMLTAVLNAARPHIAAAERERMILAVRRTCACDPCKSAVVDLIGGHHRQGTVPTIPTGGDSS